MAEPEHIADTLDAKNERLKDNSSFKCDTCGSDGHKTEGHGKQGGARKGAGIPKGTKTSKTREREAVLESFRNRVQAHADKLFNAQANMATGEQYLYCRTTSTDSKGKEISRTEIVTDPETIRQYLDGELEDDNEYYYLSTKPANNMAIDSLLNRAFGTPNKNIDLKSNGQTILDRMDETDVRRIALAMGEALSGTDDDTAN